MLKVSNEFNQYISQISLDFMKYTHNMVVLAINEGSRQKNIRLELILLLKLYKGIELTDREKEILLKHPFQFDYRADLDRCIYQVVYEISDKTSTKVRGVIEDKPLLFDGDMAGMYFDYLNILKKYTDSLLHAICFNHQVILTNPVNNEIVQPKMNFDDECLVSQSTIFTKKRKKTLI